MPRNDLLEQSAPRAELDQRSREARLRLERVEQLLAVRSLPRPSLLRRVLRRLGPRIYMGRQIEGRSASPAATGGRAHRGRGTRGEAGGAAGSFPAALPLSWPTCLSARVGRALLDPLEIAFAATVLPGYRRWSHRCGRGDANSHISK
jgi:hypothetical protein